MELRYFKSRNEEHKAYINISEDMASLTFWETEPGKKLEKARLNPKKVPELEQFEVNLELASEYANKWNSKDIAACALLDADSDKAIILEPERTVKYDQAFISSHFTCLVPLKLLAEKRDFERVALVFDMSRLKHEAHANWYAEYQNEIKGNTTQPEQNYWKPHSKTLFEKDKETAFIFPLIYCLIILVLAVFGLLAGRVELKKNKRRLYYKNKNFQECVERYSLIRLWAAFILIFNPLFNLFLKYNPYLGKMRRLLLLNTYFLTVATCQLLFFFFTEADYVFLIALLTFLVVLIFRPWIINIVYNFYYPKRGFFSSSKKKRYLV